MEQPQNNDERPVEDTGHITDFHAIMVCEGVTSPDSYEEWVACWQHLLDGGLVWQLQGWFGRTAKHLLKEGIIHASQGN